MNLFWYECPIMNALFTVDISNDPKITPITMKFFAVHAFKFCKGQKCVTNKSTYLLVLKSHSRRFKFCFVK